MIGGGREVKGQKTYATIAGKNGFGVTNENNAKTTDASIQPTLTPYANINVTGIGGALGGTPRSGSILLNFPSVPSGKSVYVRIANNTLTGIGGTFNAEPLNNLVPVPGTGKLVVGPDGFSYYVVKATGTFNGVQITATGNGGALGTTGTANIDVHYAFYSSSDCGITLGTDWSAGPLGGTVYDQQLAIDGNPNTYSKLAPSALLSYVDQNFYFPESSTTPITLTVSAPPKTGLSLGLLNNIIITAYNGTSETKLWEAGAGTLLSLDLLQLLGDGTPTTFTLSPNVSFDRIKINYGSVANLFSEFYIREVKRTPSKPTFSSPTLQDLTSCSGVPITLTPITPDSGNELRWYSSPTATTVLATSNTYTPSPTVTTTYYVATATISCTAESERVPVKVTINPIAGGTIATDQSICPGTKPSTITSAAPGTGTGTVTYQWQKSSGDNSHYTNISGATALTYTENSNLTQKTYYKRIATASHNGVVCSSGSNEVIISIYPVPSHPSVNVNSN